MKYTNDQRQRFASIENKVPRILCSVYIVYSFICECDEGFTGGLCEVKITCLPGYSYENGGCQDIEECLDTGTCEGDCTNTEV